MTRRHPNWHIARLLSLRRTPEPKIYETQRWVATCCQSQDFVTGNCQYIIKSPFSWRLWRSASCISKRVSEYHCFHMQHNKLWQLQTDNWNKSNICSFTATTGQAVYLDSVRLYWFSESDYNKECHTKNSSQSKGFLLAEMTEVGGRNTYCIIWRIIPWTWRDIFRLSWNKLNHSSLLAPIITQINISSC